MELLLSLPLLLVFLVPTRQETQVCDLIEKLGNDSIEARETADSALRGLGLQHLPLIAKTAQMHPDLEVRLRATAIFESLTCSHCRNNGKPRCHLCTGTG